ncbi:MAG: PIG-L family deacetylase [Cyanobacteria bacterium P01_A01_bin.45]
MSKTTFIRKIQVYLGAKIRDVNAELLYRWFSWFKSQPLEVTNKSAIIFSPHQDDETLGCGGMIALKRSNNIPVMVVFLTDGKYGRPEWIEPEEIVDFRQQEAKVALCNLGIDSAQTSFLNHTDGSLSQLLEQKNQEVINNILEVLTSFKPGEVYVPHSKDGHPDHEATYKLVKLALLRSGLKADIIQYPIWLFWQNPLSSSKKYHDIANAYRISIKAVKHLKQKAIISYKSQIPNLPSSLLNSFFSDSEIFFKS